MENMLLFLHHPHEPPACYIIPCYSCHPVSFSFLQEGKKYHGGFAGYLPEYTAPGVSIFI